MPASPPPIVFWIMWSLLYALLGITWAWARESQMDDAQLYDILFGVLIAIMFLWTIRYSTGQHMKESILTLYGNFLYILCIWSVLLVKQNYAAITFTPLVAWFIFALQLSIAETNFYLPSASS